MDNLQKKNYLDMSLRDLYFKWKDTNITMYKELKLYRKLNFKNKDYSLVLGIDLFIITLLLIILYM
tara:strand:+ start:25 stop:222 length:198 start_codon:yes stop_codon:yes gene_type:complete